MFRQSCNIDLERNLCFYLHIAYVALKKTDKQHWRNLRGCIVHVDNIKSYICPTNAHINYSKIIELLTTTVIAATCFGLHKPSSGSSQSVFRQS